MDAYNGWRFAPAIAGYLGRQSLSDRETLDILKALEPNGWAAPRIEAFMLRMQQAGKINTSEHRAAGHWALRAAATETSLKTQSVRFAPDSEDLIPKMRAVHERSRVLAEQIRAGTFKSDSGKPFNSVLHIGIGGSDIGPKLLINALRAQAAGPKPGIEFLSNLDYHAVQQTLANLDPHQTLIVLASKSFSTQETMTNATHVLQWMREAGVANPEKNCIAVTQRTDRAAQWAIPESQTLWVDESIGGRFSIWGPVSITARIILGNSIVDAFISGGCAMDTHFTESAPSQNLAAILSVIDLYNVRQRKLPTLMVSAYDSRLDMLVPYLQQLWMESLGKHVDTTGTPLQGPPCPVLWGDVGTNAQHAFFQLLHQGGQGVAIELIGVVEPAHAQRTSHHALLANLIAQAQALSIGSDNTDPNKVCLGGHPVNVLLLDRCDGYCLGALISLWEHRVECMAALTGINPFDQWGVELGKTIAAVAFKALDASGDTAPTKTASNASTLDSKSLELIRRIKDGGA